MVSRLGGGSTGRGLWPKIRRLPLCHVVPYLGARSRASRDLPIQTEPLGGTDTERKGALCGSRFGPSSWERNEKWKKESFTEHLQCAVIWKSKWQCL